MQRADVRQLSDLLRTLLDEHKLRRIARELPEGDELAHWLPGAGVSFVQLADALADEAVRRGRARALLALLRNQLPGRAAEIDAVVARFDIAQVTESAPRTTEEPETWDVFLAHPKELESRAARLYDALVAQPHGRRVFLDKRCIAPGDAWLDRIRGALRRTRVFAVLIGPTSDTAWFQSEEILTAIEVTRREPDDHKIVPVLVDGAELSFPLLQRQAIGWSDSADASAVVSGLVRAVANVEAKAASRPGPV